MTRTDNNKKKREGLAPTSPSSMRAGSCSSQRAVGLGTRGDAHRSFDTTIGTIGSRPSRRSRLRPGALAWACTFSFDRTTSRPYRWPNSCACCSPICVDTSFCSGMVDGFTRDRPSTRCALHFQGSTSSASPVTASRAASRTFGSACTAAPVEFGAPRTSSARSCWPNVHMYHDGPVQPAVQPDASWATRELAVRR